jgi:hypothetical protein
MKNNNNKILITLVVILLIGVGFYLFYPKSENAPAVTNPNPTPVPSPSPVYTNPQYGFAFSLPNDWEGYSIVQKTWNGTPSNATAPTTGPEILIRNPNWTSAVHYEDIPILIFTIAQWNSYTAGNFMISAAPFPATEMARNNQYVFALPPRWDYDYSKGYQEADAIVKMNPIHTFTVGASSTDQSAVTQTVTDFGQKLQLVSLLAPSSDVKTSMNKEYAPYVAPALLSSWESNPTIAPGRTVSSPWPDRIEISGVVANTDGSYAVTGTVIEVTSTEVKNGTSADTYPVTMTLQKINNAWLITAFHKGSVTVTPVSG